MEPEELVAWRNFCEGKEPHEHGDFSSIFMEESCESDLRTLFSYVPNSSRTLEKMLRVFGERAKDKSEREIIELVNRDLAEKRRFIDDPQLLAAMDLGVSDVLINHDQFRQVFEAPLNVAYIEAIADRDSSASEDPIIAELSNAFYYIASDLHLQVALTVGLVGDVSFDNYFELYLIGVDYALDPGGVLVLNYRANATKIDRSWLTPTVLSLARAIKRDGAYNRMPVLGDALEESGCTNCDILEHCRSNQKHVRGCWVMDLLLGKK